MDLQPCRRALIALAAIVCCGCLSHPVAHRPAYDVVGIARGGSSARLYQSAHHLLYTTLEGTERVEAIIATLEASYAACIEVTGVRPPANAQPQRVFVFEKRAEWEAFTRARAGVAASIYLKLDRGGYTLGKACVVRDQGERDTLTVLSHEELHLFIANNFSARPPPFIEEGLATLLEDVHVDEGVATIEIGKSGSKANRLAMMGDTNEPLKSLLSMHAGNVVGLAGTEVDAFYAQAWSFVRFLREGEGGRYRPMLMKMIQDASTGALSSDSLADDPALVERYLGVKLPDIDPAYRRFVKRLE